MYNKNKTSGGPSETNVLGKLSMSYWVGQVYRTHESPSVFHFQLFPESYKYLVCIWEKQNKLIFFAKASFGSLEGNEMEWNE